MNLSIGTKIRLGFAIAFAVVLIVGGAYFHNADEVKADAAWVTHTFEVLQQLHNLVNGLSEAESAERAYIMTFDGTFHEKATTASAKITKSLGLLRTLTADNPVQQSRLDALASVISQRLDALERKVQLLKASQGKMTIEIETLFQKGTNLMSQAQQLATEIEDEEQSLLSKRQSRAKAAVDSTSGSVLLSTLLSFALLGITGMLVKRSITKPLDLLSQSAARIGGGDYRHRVQVSTKDEVGHLASVFNQMGEQIEQRRAVLEEQDWLKTTLARFTHLFQGQRDLSVVCQLVLAELASAVDARHSAFYLRNGAGAEEALRLGASYAADDLKTNLSPGEGLPGQCFLDREVIVLRNIPADYLKIHSALGRGTPTAVVVLPILFETQVKGVIELASFCEFKEIHLTLVKQLAESIGIVLDRLEAVSRTEQLLQTTKLQAANLEGQQAELKDKNQELEAQTERLRDSEERLQGQQEELKQANEEMQQANEELQQANEEMEEKAHLLEEQRLETELKNHEIEESRRALAQKAGQLALASKYKTEFLASMSHELRTPLNSLLILSRMLADNSANNLTPKQVQYAQTINSSGNDLLEMINDILDLAKIESGTAEAEFGEVPFAEVARFVEETFRHVAENKRLDFQIRLDPQLPNKLTTDGRRLQQVIKNLLSNAFKFTGRGSVELKIQLATSGWDPHCKTLNDATSVIALAVTDTGIGIPKEKQAIIFEAFQQADSGTARRYGGTGLGLSISREIALLLGGSLRVESESDKGSTFVLFLPTTPPQRPPSHLVGARQPQHQNARIAEELSYEEIPTKVVEDDKANIRPGDLVLLIVEDDDHFARVLIEFAHNKKFKAVVASTAATAMALTNRFKPAAITLDLMLPDNDGWVVLDRLKHDPGTRHIPVHVISVAEERQRCLRLGAVSFLQKPVTQEAIEEVLTQTLDFIRRQTKNLLVIEDNALERQSIVELIGGGDVQITAVGTGAEGLAVLATCRFDCLVLDLGLPDMGGIELIREIQKRHGRRSPPVIVYTGKQLTRLEETQLRQISESIIVKDVRSPERLLDETALFLHRVQSGMPESKQRMIEQVQKDDAVLSTKKVLIVDDDVRNIFAIASALESYRMKVLHAESGRAGIEVLEANPDIDAVLMDVMMPEMDGCEAIRRIRQIEAFRKLVIVSVTAKAMKGDREKCLQAGASDYITKPVDMDQLRSVLRIWLKS